MPYHITMKRPRMRMFLLGIPACAMLMTWASGAESRKWTSATRSVIEGKMAEPYSFHVIDFELAPPAKATP